MVTLTLLAFIGLVWLREQILHGGGPEWLENELEEDAERIMVLRKKLWDAIGAVDGVS